MDRGHRTDTTTDTSIEDGSSDDRSHTPRHDDYYDGIAVPSMLPPPPLLQEHPTSNSLYDFREPASLDDPMMSRRYNTMGGRAPALHAVDNNVYASINRQRKQELSHGMNHEMSHHAGQDLPLPPPPPPIHPYMGHDPLSRGQSQCSVAGCRSDTGTVNSVRSLQSRQSRQSRHSRSSKKTRRGRETRSPKPPTHSPASSRSFRSRGDREHIELVSTNM